MRKLNLQSSVLQKGESLTRSQLKKLLGGYGSYGDGGADVPCTDTNECDTSGVACGTGSKGKCTTYGCGSGKQFKHVLYCIMP